MIFPSSSIHSAFVTLPIQSDAKLKLLHWDKNNVVFCFYGESWKQSILVIYMHLYNLFISVRCVYVCVGALTDWITFFIFSLSIIFCL